MLVRILLAVDPVGDRRRLGRLVRGSGVHAVSIRSGRRVMEQVAHGDFDIVLVSRHLLDEPVQDRIAEVRGLPETPEVIVLSDREDAEDRVRLLASGCLAVLNSELPDISLRDALRSLLDRRRSEALRRLQADRPEERYSLSDFVSVSPAMRPFLDLARKVAFTDTSLLILGETGVGKERLARAIHAESPRARGPFLAVNCGALPETLLESELFGHEEGAFTGASRARRGYFELAHRGTLFLDEVGEIPLHLQVKLLRAVQDRAIQRIGSEQPIQVDVRIMAASNRDLEAEMKSGNFRADLFFRLAVVTLQLPALRERKEDIPPLVESYFERYRTTLGRPLNGIGPEAMDALVEYSWPGNVRELINVMEQACLLSAGPRIELSDLPHRIVPAGPGSGAASEGFDFRPYLETLLPRARRDLTDTFERAYLIRVLGDCRGRIGQAARRSGVNERTLYGLMKRHRLRKEDFKE